MKAKNAILCCLLFVLVLHADQASADNHCYYRTPWIPFCKEWMCKSECWTEAALLVATVTDHQCRKGGIKGWCYCRFCSL
ncbi:hypothetical protein BS78_06G028200 [Paspalum vaginatum]|nr:hypothetical protein BS78_06G028200 [Paspalum vaginatum]